METPVLRTSACSESAYQFAISSEARLSAASNAALRVRLAATPSQALARPRRLHATLSLNSHAVLTAARRFFSHASMVHVNEMIESTNDLLRGEYNGIVFVPCGG